MIKNELNSHMTEAAADTSSMNAKELGGEFEGEFS